MLLPPDVSSRKFSAALDEFASVVGKKWVITSPEHLITYRDEFGPLHGEPQEPLASAAVCPKKVTEIQQILDISNKSRIPLWVISCGKNFSYGGPAPLLRGSVVVDLKRMNKILEVNEEQAYALVEPGVSYFDLYRHIQENNLKLWIDGPVGGWGSIVANTIERGVGQSYLGDFYKFQCGMEVVLPNGEIVRTGMGAIPKSKTWQQYKWGFGPVVDGLFSQSNHGIVTKIGTWLIPEPPAFFSCLVKVPNMEDIIPLIEKTRPLRQTGVLVNAAIFPTRMGRIKNKKNHGGWFNKIGFYGQAEVNEIHWEHVRDIYSSIPGVEFTCDKFKTPYNVNKMNANAKTLAGIPTVGGYGYKGIFCSPILPFTGEAVWKMITVFDKIYTKYGLRYFGEAIHVHQTSALVAPATVPVDMENPAMNRKYRKLMSELIKASKKQGWGVYRVTTAFMEEAMAAFDFNKGSLLRFHESLKDTLDPNGILAPGKNGIWPRRMRG